MTVKLSIRPRLLPALCLVALLLLAQALGLAHRIEHAVPASAGDAHSTLLPDHEAGDADCRLVDQLGLGDGLCGSQAVQAAAPPRTPWAAPCAAGLARRTALVAYEARAPPA